MSRIVAIVNQKGGVGKSTTAVNVAASLAAAGRKVLLVDVDPQGNTSTAFGLDEQQTDGATLYDLLTGNCSLQQCSHTVWAPWLSLIPSTPHLSGAEVELVTQSSRELRLRQRLAGKTGEFEYILLDCPPSLGLLTVNALVAADSVLVPLQCEFYAMQGLSQLLKTIDIVHEHMNPELRMDGIVLTMFEAGVGLHEQVGHEIRRHFGSLVLETVIPRDLRAAEAPSFARPAVWYDVRSPVALAYLRLTHELFLQRGSSVGNVV